MASSFTRPYVDAFFDVAHAPAAVAGELEGLERFTAAARLSPDLLKTLRNPGIPKSRRLALLDAVAGRTGCGTFGRRLLAVLLQNRRLGALGDVLGALRKRLDREGNTLEARVATARPLDPALAEAIRTLVASRTSKQIRLVSVVEPALLGGFVVTAGSARYDASLVRRLEKAREALRAAHAGKA